MEIYGYGGDFNPLDASDGNFCVNGVVNPDRIPNPHAAEVAYFYQNVWTTPGDLTQGTVKVYNDKVQQGLACENSWGAIPLPQYRIPYTDRTFTFTIRPVR